MILLEHASRDDWLAQRRDYITATDVAYLYTSPASWAKIRAEKDGTAPERGTSLEMQWGTAREAALVAYAQTIEPSIQPNDQVCVHPDGPWAATPDGIGDDVVCEVKTGSVSGLASARRRHQAQMQWQMWVTGTAGCLYVTEVRDWDDMGFAPGGRSHEWIDRDEDHIAELLDVADRFLSGDDVTELDVLIAAVDDIQAEADKVGYRLEEAKDALRDHIGDRDFSHEGPFGRVSYTMPKPRETLDTKRLKDERPDIASEYTRVSEPAKRTLRVTGADRG